MIILESFAQKRTGLKQVIHIVWIMKEKFRSRKCRRRPKREDYSGTGMLKEGTRPFDWETKTYQLSHKCLVKKYGYIVPVKSQTQRARYAIFSNKHCIQGVFFRRETQKTA
uniref:Uncharacterized protein n=1 Tax=Cacopsylla melanoneura TaxID=428564 RepID=A0A8D9F8H4_9HEMI